MRVTTKVIQNNSVSNINANKVIQDKLNNQMATEKKIVRPSDDPVVAIRALRLRTNVSQVSQYYDKNIPDAESWMSVTEDALNVVSNVLTDMIEQCTKGSSEKLTATDRNTILEALKGLRDEVYSTGNADYAGRSVFTGYRTETTLKFTEATSLKYSITEQLQNSALDTIRYVNKTIDINNINEVNFMDTGYSDIVEQDIEETTICRMRLAYSNVDNLGVKPVIQTYDSTATPPGYAAFNDPVETEIISQNTTPNPYDVMKQYDKDNETAYQTAYDAEYATQIGAGASEEDAVAAAEEAGRAAETDKFILVPETGELLMTRTAYEKLMQLTDEVSTSQIDEGEIRVSYDKSDWKLDDLKPEHYFACVAATKDGDITYNPDYLIGIHEKQAIEYDVGLNQSIRVNTTADEVFTHDIGRDIDDLISSMQGVIDMTETVERLEKIALGYADTESAEYIALHNEIDAANKALTFLKEKNQKLFEGSITKMQNHLNVANYATTNCGTRESKLALIKNRLMSQKTNFETLQSENEDIDMTEAAIHLSSAELTYQAALMSVSKIMQTSLMNYI